MGDKNDGELGSFEGIDLITFSQILEMDEPGDTEFSHSIVYGFFEQAEDTFKEMDAALEEGDLNNLSALGHFLKGSSATLGLVHVRDGCEKIQQYGKQVDLEGNEEPDTKVCLERITEAIETVKKDFKEAREILEKYYDDDNKA